jgi:hypothetical protein
MSRVITKAARSIGRTGWAPSWLECTARRGGGAIHVNLENAVSLYWSERDKATVIAFIGGETPSSWKRNPIKYWAAK